ncbi:dermatopontin [Biomphalaria glabrata]
MELCALWITLVNKHLFVLNFEYIKDFQLLRMVILVSLGLLLVVTQVKSAAYVNDWDKPFNFNCPTGQILSFVSSINDNYYEDRRWELFCRTVGYTKDCVKSDYVNTFDNPVTFTCPGDSVITGIESYHDNHYEDRRYRFQCCTVSKRVPSDCYTTDYVNDWDGKLTLFVPEGQGIKGAMSEHNNYYEDRRWRFTLCTV